MTLPFQRPTPFNPRSLFKNGEKGLIIDPTNKLTTYTVLDTTLVASDDDAIAQVKDLSPNGWTGLQATAGNKPQFNTTTYKRGAYAFVTDDYIEFTAAAASIFQNASYGTIMAFVHAVANISRSQVLMVSNNITGGTTRLALTVSPTTNKANVTSRRLDADAGQVLDSTASVTGAPHVLTAEADWANTIHQIAIDLNAPESATPTWGAGSATSNTASLGVTIGATNVVAGNPMSGDIGRMIVIARKLTSDERNNAIRWCARPYGAFL